MKTILFSFIFCLIHVCLTAQPGTLDRSFGDTGKVLTPVPGGYPLISASATDVDGSIILVGSTEPSQITNGGFSILKYSPDGILDTSFGNKGQVIVQNLGFAEAVVIQPDNKIIVAGYDGEYSISIYFTLTRLNPDGSLDKSFGSGGKVKDSYGTVAHDIALQSDGKIVVSGYAGVSFVTIRYMPDGSHDNEFGTNGVVTNFTSVDIAFANFIQPDGKIVAAGQDNNGQKALLVRYNTDGSLDESFGSIGIVSTSINNFVSNVHDAVLQEDGKIIIAGSTSDGFTYNTMLLRYLGNGSLDSSFGTNGMLVSQLQYSSSGLHIALQKDNKIVISGYTLNTTDQAQFLLERFNNNSTLDSSFGENGVVITNVGYPGEANGLIIQPSGKIVATGFAINALTDSTEYYAALARFDGDSTKRQIIINKIKHYISTHNNTEAATLNNNITLYPNPVNNVLTIKGLSAINNYQLIINNSKGSVVATKQVNNISSYQFNVQNLSSGVYYVNVVSSNTIVATLKFVKQ